MLAAVSSVVALVVAYLSGLRLHQRRLHGLHTHTVGRVFSPAVSLIFVLKIVLLVA